MYTRNSRGFFLECIIVHYFYLNFTCYHSAHVKASLKFSSIDNDLAFLLTLLIYYYPIFQIINTDRKKLFESLMVLLQKIFSTTNLKSRDVKNPQAPNRIIHLSYPYICCTVKIIIKQNFGYSVVS